MEPLCPNHDLSPLHLSPTSTKPPKPISLPLSSYQFSSLNHCSGYKLRASKRCAPLGTLKSRAEMEPLPNWEECSSSGNKLVKFLARGFVTFAAAAAAMSCVYSESPASSAGSLTVAFPVSRTQEVNTVQRTLVEAWGLIRETFVDPTFNHQDWDSKLQQTMVEMFPLRSADAAYSKIRGMLSTLGDPFTRIISPKDYQSFRIGSDGNLQGVGLFINAEPKTGHLVVLSCVEDSPAARAGIHQGDELLEINGENLDGVDSETAAQKLRGRVGTTVRVKLLTGSDSTARETAAAEMETAVHEMEGQGVQSYILDLRNNPGGLVKAGLDVAQIWLDGNETLVNTIDRDGNLLPINMVDGHAVTQDPLVVLVSFGLFQFHSKNAPRDFLDSSNFIQRMHLTGYSCLCLYSVYVNEGSASTSEILAGALHDNGRAILVGHTTFGKGKIQSVTELNDGSALFITVAKYLSPALHDIDRVGITPDVQCTAEMLNVPKESGSKDKSAVSSLEADSCIMVAEHELDIQESRGTAS